ncbi:MAG: Kojibiose phosphorylase [Herbinix sp.]|jgi:kojibiose phosphorylase/nigerose phosphorylase|nr:Kojibiose phosphorylase [Herbinix sp.]
MINWRIHETGFDSTRISNNGNKYLIGNGYLGIRGTLQEYEKEQYPAINLAGIYDQVGSAWREPLNAPNALYTLIEVNKKVYRLPEDTPEVHEISLDYRHGIFERSTTWKTPEGLILIQAERFASMNDKHLIGMRYTLQVEHGSKVRLVTGIDGEVWDINGPHYDLVEFTNRNEVLQAVATTHENKDRICVYEGLEADFTYEEQIREENRKYLRYLEFYAQPGISYHLIKWVGIYTSKDLEDYGEKAYQTVIRAKETGYEETRKKHMEEWEAKWNLSEVFIEGDDKAMEALNYSLYHLHSIAPRHTDHLSIAARGLSGQTYKGAVFWDTEMFMLDFFLMTEPEVAKTLLNYRIETLEGAKKKAKAYGYQGAFYAWESQEGGYDACSDYNVTDVFTGRQMRTYFKDKQIHISSAVVYGLMRYVEFTGDHQLLLEGGAEVILECAGFYYDLLVKKVNKDQYELHDVIGPDEYHERVNNNVYTNRMAKYTFDSAVYIMKLMEEAEDSGSKYHHLREQYDMETLRPKYQEASDKLYLVQPQEQTGVIEQFDGYTELEDVSIEEVHSRLLHEKEYWGGAYGVATHTKIIKQADVVTMLNLFSKDYDKDILLKNWQYYEPRTEHGSSLSACMYAMLACKCGMPELAYPFFMKSALSDITQKGKEWAGLIYIGGTHPASSGGAYMTAIEGFAGIHIIDGTLKAAPALPPGWESMRFKLVFKGERYQVTVTREDAELHKIES